MEEMLGCRVGLGTASFRGNMVVMGEQPPDWLSLGPLVTKASVPMMVTPLFTDRRQSTW